jgi:hypothetical protein
MTLTSEETAEVAPAKPAKKASVGARRAPVPRAKAAESKKAKATDEAPRSGKKVNAARDSTKAAQVRELLKRQGGASLKEIMKATDWQAHTVRGFLSGVLRKKLGLTVDSAKGEDGGRTYSVKI